MNSHPAPEVSDNCVDVQANSTLLAAGSALFSNASGAIRFVQTCSGVPWLLSSPARRWMHRDGENRGLLVIPVHRGQFLLQRGWILGLPTGGQGFSWSVFAARQRATIPVHFGRCCWHNSRGNEFASNKQCLCL